MKKIVLAVAALALSAGAAYAENPNVGEPEDLYANDRTPVAVQTMEPGVDYRATAETGNKATVKKPSIHGNEMYLDGSAHNFGDASPSSYED